jgi:hypothetical protein
MGKQKTLTYGLLELDEAEPPGLPSVLIPHESGI